MGRLSCVVTVLLLGACSGRTAATGCEANSACEGGAVCISGTCQLLCSNDLNCTGSCCDAGVCGGSCAGRGVPEISKINGTGSPDGADSFSDNRVDSTLILEGQNFEGAEIRLTTSDGETQTLQTCGAAATSSRVEVQLPDGLSAGDYTLVAVNQAGQCSAAVTVLRGESGTDGDDGDDGNDGASCTVTPNSGGATISCGGATADIANGDPGPAGTGMPTCGANALAASDGASNFTCRDNVTLTGNVLRLPNDNVDTAANDGALIIGNPTGNRLTFDDNEIQSKDADNAGRTVHINERGGDVSLANEAVLAREDGSVSVKGDFFAPRVQISSFPSWNNAFGAVPSFNDTSRKYSFVSENCTADERGRLRVYSFRVDSDADNMIDVLCHCAQRVSGGGTPTFQNVCFY